MVKLAGVACFGRHTMKRNMYKKIIQFLYMF